MLPIDCLNTKRVFYHFEQISKIPHGSYNMDAIAQYCVDFAKSHNLKYFCDDAKNVVIYKDATQGYEHSAPIILQGHLDMVCQKTPDCEIDFLKDGLKLYVDGDFIKAHGTTLGADNGIAVAMVLAILESKDIAHPPIEALFTTDEEVGMLGARVLDMSVLKGNRMINLDSETDDIVTVSCAGGSDFRVDIPLVEDTKEGTLVTLEIGGLKGGHSGVEINKNRVNANMIAGRILKELKSQFEFDIININGGDKSNAIPNRCVIELCVKDTAVFCAAVQKCFEVIKTEIDDRESGFVPTVIIGDTAEYNCFAREITDKIIFTLLCVPNGITEMSAEIAGLVQTSLNLGVLITNRDSITLHFALRSNKMTALAFLEQRLCTFFDMLGLKYETFGQYPAWEYRENSPLRDAYCEVYADTIGKKPIIEAIHAGLECGVFAGQIKDFDCISIGPSMSDVHTVREKLSISSTQKLYTIIIEMLEKLK